MAGNRQKRFAARSARRTRKNSSQPSVPRSSPRRTAVSRREKTQTAESGRYRWGAREENRKTLIKTGRLRDSYTREVGHDSVEVGSNAKYAAIHHFGGVIRAKNAKALRFRIGESFVMKKAVTMPARPALGLNGEDEDHIMETTEDWIAGFVREIK